MLELCRAVDENERRDIEAKGRFRLVRRGSGFKYFALSREGAEREAAALRSLTGRPHAWIFCAVWRSKVPLGARRFIDATPFGPVEAAALSGDDLRKLGPARMIGTVGD